ncbi:hypothetical protein [Streptacidiphilus sp. MAP12-16]|uniref:hypothetical protein n=1 Tax=Streptacidiphilus sp. MAP12-16 TaxID=3156300 RepID=UPI003519A4CF
MLTLLVAVLAALVGPTGTAYAVASQPTTKATATATPTRTSTATTKPAPSTSATAAAKPKLVTKPTAPVKAQIPTGPKADAKKLSAAAVRSAIAHSSVPDTCSGPITADTVYPCTTPSAGGTDTYTLTLPNATDLLLVRATSTGGNALPITINAPDSSVVTCQQPYGHQNSQCATAQAGTYTVRVQNGGGAYTLAYTPLLSDASCTVADPSFSAPTLQGAVAASTTGNCYTLAMTSGSVLHVGLSSTPWQDLTVAVYDATGTQICIDDEGDCTLTGTAPYRVLASNDYGQAVTYFLQLNSVSQPQGCLTVTQQTYGTVPDSSSAVACRTLTVTTADQYQVYAATSQFGGISGTLYHPDGTAACTNSGSTCQLVPGTYDFVATEYPASTPPFGVVFIAADESRGCTATGDTGFASGPATGGFSGIAEEICLTLPTASGKSDYIFDQPTADGSNPQMQVVDATGAQQCPSASFNYATCQLTGTAPFRALLSAQEATGGYQLLLQRTDSSSGCAVWPQSGFGGSWGAEVSLTVSSYVKCLSIPANQHSVGEMIDYQNIANKVDGNITVNDPSGKQICIGFSTAICSYAPGVAYTALVEGVKLTGSDTYKVVRRDVSRTASCSTPASTTVGGPSTGFLLTSALDAVCVRITAAATDKIWTSARANVPAPAGAVLEVADATGSIICRQWGVSCQVTGSTSYQVIVIASGYAGITIPARVDTWRVGTAAGWASECTAHQLSANGFAPQNGSLTETSTGYCAVVQMPTSELLGVGIVTPTHTGSPWVSMYDNADWTNGIGICNIGGGGNNFSFQCQTPSSTTDQAVMMVTPGNSPTPIDYVMQGVCERNCATPPAAVTLNSLSPAVGPAGTQNQVVVHGTGLNLGTELDLASNGTVVSNYQVNQVVSASPDGTSLTVLLSTAGLTPGKYDLMLDGVGYSVGTPSPGYLPGAYTVTAAPTPQPNSLFVPLTPSRILDTRSGLGAPKARVGARQTVKLQVDGVAGVPASGVTAVAMNVTEVNAAGAGFVTVYPDGKSLPTVSNLNFNAGQTIPNLVVIPVINGKIDLYNGSSGAVDLLADITGYYSTSGSGSALTTVGPSRILDTRSGLGAPKVRVGARQTVKLQVDGVAGVPASGVTAVAMNVTEVNAAGAGFVTVYPDGKSLPTVSNLNFNAGQTIPNLVVVPVIDGKIDLYNGSSGAVDLLADITGYYSTGGSGFQTVGPVRVMDTRTGLGRAGGAIVPGGAASLSVMDLPGTPVPGTVTAVVLNVTVTGPTSGGFLTVFPNSQPLPTVSNLNFSAGQTIPNLVVVPVINGKIDFYNGSAGTVQVIADLDGYYTT